MNRTRVVLQTMITLAAASLGLVAALAWNEAIKALIRKVLGEDDSLAGKADNPYRERVRINRIEYADGSIWQRKDWNFAEVRAAVQRAVSTPWGAEMCRGL